MLVDSLSTFTASELIDYNEFVGLAIIVNVLVLKRVDLKKKVFNLVPQKRSWLLANWYCWPKQIIASPEVSGVIQEVPLWGNYLMSIYDCNYAKFFVALGTYASNISKNVQPNPTTRFPASLEQEHLLTSRVLSPHARYYVREMRILAYAQILESYRSLTLNSLASSFGVSVDFVDRWVTVFSTAFSRRSLLWGHLSTMI